MSFKPLDDRQVIQRSALSNSIGTSADTTLDLVFEQIDSVMVNLAGLQQITNKTIGTSNSGLLSNSLQFTEISTPNTNPSSGKLALYPKSDGNFYSLDSSGTEKEIGGASGSSPVGSIIPAFLTLSQFQTQMGTGWIISDGSAVPGSEYEAITGNSYVTASDSATATTVGATVTFSTSVLSTTGTTNSNNQLTNVSPITGVAVGQIISGTGIPAVTTVSSIDQYTFSLPGTPDQYTFAVHSSDQYIFTVSSANATAGAVYTNNGQSFTVDSTIVGATTLDALGTGAPLASGTLTLSSGTGDATITFSSFTYAGANASSGAVYTNNGQSFTVSSTISDGISLTAIGTGDPVSSGTLTLSSGTGDATIIFTSFIFGAHNATAGAVYTNNGQSFTVASTIDDKTTLVCTGTGIPTASGTLTLSSGTGDSTISFTSVSANITMSQAATSSISSGSIIFSTFDVSTTGNLTNSSATITNLASTVGIATGQIISVNNLSPFATVSSVSITTVPDTRGMFIRGSGTNAAQTLQNGGYPSGASVGGYQQDMFASHVHSAVEGQFAQTVGTQFTVGGGGFDWSSGSDTAAAGNVETRPVSVSVNWFIRIN